MQFADSFPFGLDWGCVALRTHHSPRCFDDYSTITMHKRFNFFAWCIFSCNFSIIHECIVRFCVVCTYIFDSDSISSVNLSAAHQFANSTLYKVTNHTQFIEWLIKWSCSWHSCTRCPMVCNARHVYMFVAVYVRQNDIQLKDWIIYSITNTCNYVITERYVMQERSIHVHSNPLVYACNYCLHAYTIIRWQVQSSGEMVSGVGWGGEWEGCRMTKRPKPHIWKQTPTNKSKIKMTKADCVLFSHISYLCRANMWEIRVSMLIMWALLLAWHVTFRIKKVYATIVKADYQQQ